MSPYGLNGGESTYQPEPNPPARAVSCSLSEIVDDAIELLTLIDQPTYWNEEKVCDAIEANTAQPQPIRSHQAVRPRQENTVSAWSC